MVVKAALGLFADVPRGFFCYSAWGYLYASVQT